MKILFVISSMRCGGAERVASTLITDWATSGHEISLFTWSNAETDFFPVPAEIKRYGLNQNSPSKHAVDAVRRNIKRIKYLRETIRAIAPDVIVSFMDGNNIISILASCFLNIPIVISERSNPARPGIPLPWRLLRRATYHFADALVVQSGATADWAKKTFPGVPCYVFPNPLSTEILSSAEATCNSAAGEADFRPRKKKEVVLAVGRLAPEKQFDKLIECFAQLAPGFPNWQLVIVGDGPEKAKLQAAIAASAHSQQFLLTGAITRPAPMFAESQVFVLCSRFEGFPNTLIEAMAHGTVPITFATTGGVSEIIEHQVTGFITPDGNWPLLRDELRRVMNDTALLASVGNAASIDVLRRFKISAIAPRWLQLFRELTNE